MTLARHALHGRICGGLSMAPTVLPGDSVHLAAPAAPRAGDAVLFKGHGDYEILHRFLFKVPLVPYFVHRGDAVTARVGLACCDRIVGVAALPRREVSVRELADGCALVLRRAARRLLVRDERR